MQETRKEINTQVQNNLKVIKRSLDHKIDKLSEIGTDSNKKLLKSVAEKFDEKLDPIYERMEQLVESFNSSNSSNDGYNLYIYTRKNYLPPLIIIFFLSGNGQNQDQVYKILYEKSEKQSEYHKELLRTTQARSDKVYDHLIEKEQVEFEERRAAIEREGLLLDDQNECKFLNTLAETSVKFSEENQKLFLGSVSGILDSRTKRRKLM